MLFWLQGSRNELHSTEAVLQILRYLGSSGGPEAALIRDRLTVIVIPMYNPDGGDGEHPPEHDPVPDRPQPGLGAVPAAGIPRLLRALGGDPSPTRARPAPHGAEPIVEGTNELNTFQIGARSIEPSRMTAEQWLTNRQMALISVEAVSKLGTGNVARYPLIDITNVVISRRCSAAPGRTAATRASRHRARSSRSPLGGAEEQRDARAALRPPDHGGAECRRGRQPLRGPGTGWDEIPFGDGEPCGGGPDVSAGGLQPSTEPLRRRAARARMVVRSG